MEKRISKAELDAVQRREDARNKTQAKRARVRQEEGKQVEAENVERDNQASGKVRSRPETL